VTLDQKRLQELLSYDPETGVWTWLVHKPHSKMYPGDVAGRIMDSGRRQIRIDYEYYYAARLAWLYMTGEWPQEQIDHINQDKGNNRWVNLRKATQSQNSYNREWAERSGLMRGVQRHGNQWRVDIGNQYLGLYPRLEPAQAIRDLALWYKAGRFANLPKGELP